MSAAIELGCAFLDIAPIRTRLWAVFELRAPYALHALCWSGPDSSVRDALQDSPLLARELTAHAWPESIGDLLERYFRGEDVEPTTLAVAPSGTAFQLRVWNALRSVPRGQVRSYAGIANDLGQPRATRAVGGANGRNPIAVAIPCHRVVETGMQLGGYSGGLHIKRFLLELEGARITGDRVQPGQLELL